jgi:hypothetical protein
MTAPFEVPSRDTHSRRAPARDAWFLLALLTTIAAYAALPFMTPSGEGWGRGWNLVAFWLYSAPAVVIAGVLASWRIAKIGPLRSWWPAVLPFAAFVYPLVALLALRDG